MTNCLSVTLLSTRHCLRSSYHHLRSLTHIFTPRRYSCPMYITIILLQNSQCSYQSLYSQQKSVRIRCKWPICTKNAPNSVHKKQRVLLYYFVRSGLSEDIFRLNSLNTLAFCTNSTGRNIVCTTKSGTFYKQSIWHDIFSCPKF